MPEIVKIKVCKCENCGNKAEMVVTCSLSDTELEDDATSDFGALQKTTSEKRVMGIGT